MASVLYALVYYYSIVRIINCQDLMRNRHLQHRSFQVRLEPGGTKWRHLGKQIPVTFAVLYFTTQKKCSTAHGLEALLDVGGMRKDWAFLKKEGKNRERSSI